MNPKKSTGVLVALGLILLVGTALRINGLNYGLPYIYHADEPIYIRIAQDIFKTGDFNPHFFRYPSLFFYLNAAAYLPYYLAGRQMGLFVDRGDLIAPEEFAMGMSWAAYPSMVLLGRLLTVLFGLATIVLVYLIGQRMSGKPGVGLLAALLVAIAPSNVQHSQYVTPDTFVTFFSAASLLAALAVYRQGHLWHYLAAGACIGLTASCKYNGALAFLPVLAAHIFRSGWAGWRDPKIYLAGLVSLLAFLVGTPFAILDFPVFLADLRFEARHYATGHPGMEGDTVVWYLKWMWNNGGVVYLLAAAEIMRGLAQRSKTTLLVAAFPLGYYLMINLMVVRNARTFLPLTPFLFLLAASLLVYLYKQAWNLPAARARVAGLVLAIGLALAALVTPSIRTAEYMTWLSYDEREASRLWITQNLPPGAKIAQEVYTPVLDPNRFQITTVKRIIDHDIDWYRQNGYDYIVFGRGMFGRYLSNPERYPQEAAQYRAFFETLTRLERSPVEGDLLNPVYPVK